MGEGGGGKRKGGRKEGHVSAYILKILKHDPKCRRRIRQPFGAALVSIPEGRRDLLSLPPFLEVLWKSSVDYEFS